MSKNLVLHELVGALDDFISLLDTFESESDHGRNVNYLETLLEKVVNLQNENKFFDEQSNAQNITDFLIMTAQDGASELSGGLNYIIGYGDVEKALPNVELTDALVDEIIECLQQSEEIADIQVYDECFDVLLFGAYAPNYEEDEEE